MAKKTRRSGRKPLSPYGEATVAVKLPRALIDRIERFADGEFCTRALAIRTLLERGLEMDR